MEISLADIPISTWLSVLLVGALVWSPGHAIHAFNPITTTGAAIMFCLIQLVESTTMEKSVE